MRQMFACAALLAAAPLLGASEPAPAEPTLAAARTEVARAAAEEARLTAAAARAGNEAERLAGQQRAAAAAIASAEARIAAAEIELGSAQAMLAARQARLRTQQAPVASLLAGLVTMGRRPPLLALADGSTEEFVRVRALLDATMPAIRARTAALTGELDASRRAALVATAARDRLATERATLDSNRTRFAQLEQRALANQSILTGQALGAGDATLSGSESLTLLDSEATRRQTAMAAARQAATLVPLPSRPDALPSPPPSLAYQLPLDAPLKSGLGTIDPNGIRSRGLGFSNARGVPLTVPADGTIVFAGPYRRSDGIIIIDHGDGWATLIVNAATALPRGATVHRGDPLGRATGPVEVDLTRRGTRFSAAFIAASSAMLSNSSKGR